ncbi:LacI family DNA-binding transcriptional regulator [Actinoplanes sp. NBRC 101535]|uniref:LacI family DNA-binding transcriptional regulator n=1 Tax=Actinoplanes sp. NBRC 101535 TaxID=3032196 RepID=UPI0024A22CB0|nr:LacI family DNA-binding transcriptional regulator [Actinoplanes sp. NBRC 101535]GLY07770.1 LacI family transcriptional regulator [Actinoplanes sp. NBRC 101535]
MVSRSQERATLESVAQAVGVSKATVSKALNGRSGVSEATRRRVLEAIRELDYAPTTRPASGFGPRPSIVALFDTLANLYALRMLDALIARAQSQHFEVVPLVTSPLHPGPGRLLEPERVRDLHRLGHLGLLAVTTHLPQDVLQVCAELTFPVLAIDPIDALDPSVASVGSNNWSGGFQATEHLLSLGHRRIGFVGGESGHAGLRERRAGYRAALEAASIGDDPKLVSEDGMAVVVEPVLRMLQLSDPPTAFFASSDLAAMLAIRELVRLGCRVPEDVSVVGYDDTYAPLPTPTLLTTVHTPIIEVGRLAFDTLVRMSEGVPPVANHVQLSTSLTVRESTAPPTP